MENFEFDFMKNKYVKHLSDRAPIVLNRKNATHILVFRGLLKLSMLQGRWNGFMPKVS